MRVPRILLADDHTMFLEALRSLLEPEFEIVVRWPTDAHCSQSADA